MDDCDISFSDKFIATLDDKRIDCFTIHLYRKPLSLIGWDCILKVFNYKEMAALGLSIGFGLGLGVGWMKYKWSLFWMPRI
jgi:hypothetical protein